jgi:macrolide transport system ATP-binding/permease protein
VSRLGGKELSRVRGQSIGFVFQSFNLLPYLSALGNVELGQKYAGRIDSQKAKEALARMGLGDRIKHRPNELSGGEQQRVAVARALAKDPPLILADEPTGNLDSHSSKEIMSTLSDLHTEQNITLIMITHDPNIARYCQRIVHIQDGQIVNEEKHKKLFGPLITAWTSVATHKLRSFLTILGVVIGIAAVIILMSVGKGTEARMLSNLSSMGTNIVYVQPGSTTSGGVRSAMGSASTLTLEDAEAIAEQVGNIKAIAPYANSGMQVI